MDISKESLWSCLLQTFAILYMLSEDLHHKVKIANEAYNLYNNIELAAEDEVSWFWSYFSIDIDFDFSFYIFLIFPKDCLFPQT